METSPSHRTAFGTAMIAGTFALLGAVIGSYTTSYLTLRNQLRLATIQKREEAYAALAGNRFLVIQMYVSSMQARIDFEFHHRKLELEGEPVVSPHVQETQRLVTKRDDLALEFGRANKQLFETVGLIRATFPRTAALDRITQRIYDLKLPKLQTPDQITGETDVLTWRNDHLAELENVATDQYGKPIDDLLAYVLANLNS